MSKLAQLNALAKIKQVRQEKTSRINQEIENQQQTENNIEQSNLLEERKNNILGMHQSDEMNDFIEEDEEEYGKEYREVGEDEDNVLDNDPNQENIKARIAKMAKNANKEVKITSKMKKKADDIMGDLFNEMEADEMIGLSMKNRNNCYNHLDYKGYNQSTLSGADNNYKNAFTGINNNGTSYKQMVNKINNNNNQDVKYWKVDPSFAPNSFTKNHQNNGIYTSNSKEEDPLISRLLKNTELNNNETSIEEIYDFGVNPTHINQNIKNITAFSNENTDYNIGSKLKSTFTCNTGNFNTNNNSNSNANNMSNKMGALCTEFAKTKDMTTEKQYLGRKKMVIADDDDEEGGGVGDLNNNNTIANSLDIKDLVNKTRVVVSNNNTSKSTSNEANNASGSKSKITANSLGRLVDTSAVTPIKEVSSIPTSNYLGRSTIDKNNSANPGLNQLIYNTNNNDTTFNTPTFNSSIKQNQQQTSVPLQKDKSLLFYMYDAIEEPPSKNEPEPKVILFGKVKDEGKNTYSSIAVIIKKLKRTVFLFPAVDKSTGEFFKPQKIFEEFNCLKSTKFSYLKEFDFSPVEKKYCFELPIKQGEYVVMKVKFDAKYTLPSELTGKTFSCVFGNKSALLDNVIIKLKLMGPSWVRIEPEAFSAVVNNSGFSGSGLNKDSEQLTTCKYEVIVNYEDSTEFKKKVSVPLVNKSLETPPLKLMSLATESALVNGSKEIISISGVIKDNYFIDRETGDKEMEENSVPVLLTRKILGLEANPMKYKEAIGCQGAVITANENTLLNVLIQKIALADPDIIIGHNLYSNHLEVILSRITKLKINNWSKIGKLKRTYMPKFFQSNNNALYVRNCFTGRLLCDTFLSCRDILRETSYDMEYLSFKHLSDEESKYETLDTNEFIGMIQKSNVEEKLSQLTKHALLESMLSLKLMHKLKILQLTKQLTNIAGNLWIKSLQNSRADRCEMFLMHEFIEKGYLIPDKRVSKYGDDKAEEDFYEHDDLADDVKESTHNKKKPQYSGGLVLEPKPGLYDNIVLLLDFNSLYPSIIRQYNICFTTVSRRPTENFTDYIGNGNYKRADNANKGKKGKDNNNNNSNKKSTTTNKNADYKAKKDEDAQEDSKMEIDGEINPETVFNDEDDSIINNTTEEVVTLSNITQTTPMAILPSLIDGLVKSRREVKNKMKYEEDKSKLELLEIKQKALKLSANSLYGYLGYKRSRFYAKAIAALITSTGRQILLDTVDKVTKKNLEVIYGDTDSIMINSLTNDLIEAFKIAEDVKKSINTKEYLEIELDGLFKTLLLLKKKKYAAMKYKLGSVPPSVVPEYKGLDLVRRDWCGLSKEVGKQLLSLILNPVGSKEETISRIMEFITEVRLKMETGKYGMEYYSITKQLTKKVEEYSDLKALPHVAVAKRLLQLGDLTIKPQSYIRYIICVVRNDGNDGGVSNTTGIIINPSSGNKALSDRAYELKEVLHSNGSLQPDLNWYKENQLLSSVSRLCKHISEIEMFRLAECLGIDNKKYEQISRSNDNNNQDIVEEYNCRNGNDSITRLSKTPFTFNCLNCKTPVMISSLTDNFAKNITNLKCSNCSSPLTEQSDFNYLLNLFILNTKKNIRNYYLLTKECNKCSTQSRQLIPGRCKESICNKGVYKQKISEADVTKDLNFQEAMFHCTDTEIKLPKLKEIHNKTRLLNEFGSFVKGKISYNKVDLGEAFKGCEI